MTGATCATERKMGDRPLQFRGITDNRGRFAIRGMTPGKFELSVHHSSRRHVDPLPVDIPKGRAKTGVRLQLKPLVPITATIEGRTPIDSCLELSRAYSPESDRYQPLRRFPLSTEKPVVLGSHRKGRYRISIISHNPLSIRTPARCTLATFTIEQDAPRLKLEIPDNPFTLFQGVVTGTNAKRTPWHRFVVAAVESPEQPRRSPLISSNPRAWLISTASRSRSLRI